MSINLEKRAEKVRILLEKKNLRQVPAMRVGLAVDISGSTRKLYTNGIVQQTVERLLAVAMRFDDNGEMDMWAFDDSFKRLPAATKRAYLDYVVREILNNKSVPKWGRTAYAPVMSDMLDLYFRSTPAPAEQGSGFLSSLFGKPKVATAQPASNASLPALGMFVTDGRPDDKSRAAEVLRKAKAYSMYWQLVGVGNPDQFEFLREMADELPNVGYVQLDDLDMPDEQIYEQILSDELCNWVRTR